MKQANERHSGKKMGMAATKTGKAVLE